MSEAFIRTDFRCRSSVCKSLSLRTLAKEKSDTILPADKATVIMDTAEYEEKVKEMLSDEKVYEVLKEDPTAVYKRKLVSFLTRLKEENKITEGQYKMLYPTMENTPQIYCTPKIHRREHRCVRLSITQDQSATTLPGHWRIY